MFSLILWFKTDIGMAEPGGQILIPPAGNKHMWPKYNKVPVSLSSGADVRPNFSVSQLTPGPKLIHMFKYYIDWRSSKRDQIPHPCQIITLIEDLQWRIKSPTPGKLWHGLKIFNKGSNPPPSVNCYTDWRSSKGQNNFFLENEFSKTLQHSQIAKPFPVVLNTMSSHVETVICTGMPRFWPFVKTWYIAFRANGGSWPYPYILSPAIWSFSKLGIHYWNL